MIPQTIHFIWLSEEPLNQVARDCIDTWKRRAPEFEIRRWSLSDFDIRAMPPFVGEAIAARKWAFACDYLRLWVLYNHGGWYLDSDVVLFKSPIRYAQCRYVTAFEWSPDLFQAELVDEDGRAKVDFVNGMGLQSAIQGCEPAHEFIRDCMQWYEGRHFSLPDGGFGGMLAPHIQALVARKCGFKYKPEQQFLAHGMVVLDPRIFATSVMYLNNESEMLHMCNGSWRDSWERLITVEEVERWLKDGQFAEQTREQCLRRELMNLKQSESYRLGLVLTAPLRLLWRLLRRGGCC